MRALLPVAVAALALVAGCFSDPGPGAGDAEPSPPSGFVSPTRGDYPEGAPAECPPGLARGTTYRFSVDVVFDRVDGPPNAARAIPNLTEPTRPTMEWTWRHHDAGERPDRVTRANTFELWRDGAGDHVVCARIDVAAASEETAPAEADGTTRVLAVPTEDLPPGNYTLIVNYHLGCGTCGGPLRGNASTTFLVPKPRA